MTDADVNFIYPGVPADVASQELTAVVPEATNAVDKRVESRSLGLGRELCIRTRSRVVSSEKNLGRVERIRRDIQKIVGRLTVGVGITGTRSAACPVDVVVRRTGVPGIDEGDIGVGWKPVGTGRNDLVRHIVLRPRCVLVEQIATYVALKAEV